MKLMQNMNRDELIELVSAVFLRVYAFDFALGAFRNVYHLSLYLNHSGTPNGYTANGYYMDIAFDTLISVVTFLKTVPLARLICRGLSHAFELKPSE
jgi:hypothetical protein